MTDLSRSVRRCLNVAALLSAVPLAAASAETAGLEEIVVTAQKQEQKLSETPMSVTALSASDLQALAATQFRDFANTIPGLSFTTSGIGSTQVSLRGITTGDNVSPTVGIYVDEVPYGSSTAYAGAAQLSLDVGLFDVTRVEVLRGPQGTLYGASTMGGLLKYVSVVPDLNEFGGVARAGLAATEEGGTSYDVAGAVNLPFAAGKAAARVSGFYSHDGGYVDNIGLKKDDVNQTDVYGGRADVLFQPTDKLSIRVGAYLQDISRDGSISVDYNLANEKPLYGSLDQYVIVPEPFDQRFELFSATAVYDFGSAALTSITSYQSLHNVNVLDASDLYTPLLNFYLNPPPPDPPFFVFDATDVKYWIGTDKFTQELRLASKGATLDWLVGFFYTSENSNQHQQVGGWAADGTPFPLNIGTVKLPSTYEETAGFGTLTWHLTNKLDLTGGLRYAHNSQTQEQKGSGLLVQPAPKENSSANVATYLADLRYLASDNLMGYLRFATGYRPGGPNVVIDDPETGEPLGKSTFEADRLQSYEAGLKVSSNDRRLSADAALYYINWDNMQVIDANNGFGAVANAGTARSLGAELTLTALPIPQLALVGAFAYIDAELTENAPDVGGQKGDPLPNTPDFTASVSADYSFDAFGHASSVGALLRYVDDRVSGFPENNYPPFDLSSYTTFDLRGSMAFGPALARVYVRNLFDERGQLSASTVLTGLGGPAQVDIMQPRTIGVSVDWNF